MIRITDRARERLAVLIDHLDEDACLRLTRTGESPLVPDYDLAIVDFDSRAEEDRMWDAEGIRVLASEEPAGEVTIDFDDQADEAGFLVLGPAPSGEDACADGSLVDRVQRVIDERVNPGVAAHGGHITLKEVRENVAVIEMEGGCQGCSLSQMTLRKGVERMIREAVPEILGVHDATDHAGGENPFFAS